MTDNNNDKTPDDHMKSESPLIYHVYNNNKIKVFKIIFQFFIKYIIYDYVSAMKMHLLREYLLHSLCTIKFIFVFNELLSSFKFHYLFLQIMISMTLFPYNYFFLFSLFLHYSYFH